MRFAAVLIILSGSALAQEPPKKEPPKPAPKEPAQVIQIEKSTKPDPCIIRPVMTDKELRDCGAKPKSSNG